MILTRRTLISSSAAAALVTINPVLARAPAQKKLAIFDSRLAASRALVASGQMLDVATQDATQWKQLRNLPRDIQSVVGATSWSDWVVIRGLLEERRLRVTSETQIGTQLFHWQMASFYANQSGSGMA